MNERLRHESVLRKENIGRGNGYDAFEEQLAMSSRYYKKHFFEGE